VAMMVNDEVFIERGMGWNQWDPISNEMVNYKWTQFEWLWGDTLDSIRVLILWLTGYWRIDLNYCWENGRNLMAILWRLSFDHDLISYSLSLSHYMQCDVLLFGDE